MGMRGPVEVRVDRVTHLVVADDIPEPTQEGAVKVTYETLGDLVQRIVVTGHQSADMLGGGSERAGAGVKCNLKRHTMSSHLRTRQCLSPNPEHQGHVKELTSKSITSEMEIEEMEIEKMEMDEMEIEGMEMEGMETKEEMAITLEDLCLLESAHTLTYLSASYLIL
ncbi:hypothetical protein Tco_0664280 [Tanacetum coccineum]